MVERFVWDEEAVGSRPAAETKDVYCNQKLLIKVVEALPAKVGDITTSTHFVASVKCLSDVNSSEPTS